MRFTSTVGIILAFCGSAAALTPENPPPSSALTSNFLKPRQVEGGDPLANLKLPDGYKVEVFAKDLVNPRILAVSDNGTVYVTRRSIGDVVMLKADADGKAQAPVVVASRDKMHGIAIKGSQMWLATVADVYVADIKADGTLSELQRIINDLPDAGQHPNRTMSFGPDGMLYISVGSTCNSCTESRPESATILQASPDGKQRRIFAKGLRNTIGFDWHPGTSELYGWDQSYDLIDDETPKEEFNKIEDGKYYG
ncbi:MAG: PQQ-dependent sugar dehydrogenase [Hyphomicrobiales bacterium]|mgnify:CR=1 FL=1|nr:PQQ-dependent sugar dehydrogenase [Hyphomicrobiales bacterium]